MANFHVAFEILEPNKYAPIGSKSSDVHLVYYFNMDLIHKDQWLKDGHKTSEPYQYTYAGVVLRDIFRISLNYAALNGIEVMAAGINNSYLQYPSSEKHYIFLEVNLV